MRFPRFQELHTLIMHFLYYHYEYASISWGDMQSNKIRYEGVCMPRQKFLFVSLFHCFFFHPTLKGHYKYYSKFKLNTRLYFTQCRVLMSKNG